MEVVIGVVVVVFGSRVLLVEIVVDDVVVVVVQVVASLHFTVGTVYCNNPIHVSHG